MDIQGFKGYVLSKTHVKLQVYTIF